MQESYREGIANRPGPEPCQGSREAALEALHRGICRLGIELRKTVFQDAHGVRPSEGHATAHKKRECAGDPAESETPSMQRNRVSSGRARTGRPRCRPRAVGGPEGEGNE